MSGVSDRVDDYDFSYPPEAVAQEPAPRRGAARLLGIAPGAAEAGAEASAEVVWHDGRVDDLPGLVRPGDLVVLNDVRVRPARLEGTRLQTGGRLEALILATDGRAAELLLGTRGTLTPGDEVELGGARWRLGRPGGEGRWEAELLDGESVDALVEAVGRMPLPPYIQRERGSDPRDGLDRERYQTVFSDPGQPGRAAAAPTAGLHLSEALLRGLREAGAETTTVELQVGLGTFRPLRGERLDEHEMHEERYRIPEPAAAAYARCRAAGDRVIAVGTTVTRALESAVADDGRSLCAGAGSTRLFLRPGASFRAVDTLLTNFHQPRSSLLVLVSAFAGRATILAAYEQALQRGYRMFSYGDATLLGAP